MKTYQEFVDVELTEDVKFHKTGLSSTLIRKIAQSALDKAKKAHAMGDDLYAGGKIKQITDVLSKMKTKGQTQHVAYA